MVAYDENTKPKLLAPLTLGDALRDLPPVSISKFLYLIAFLYSCCLLCDLLAAISNQVRQKVKKVVKLVCRSKIQKGEMK